MSFQATSRCLEIQHWHLQHRTGVQAMLKEATTIQNMQTVF